MYVEVKALEVILESAEKLERILQLFKSQVEIMTDLTEEDCDNIFLSEESGLQMLFSGYDIRKPIAAKAFFERVDSDLSVIAEEPNAVFIRDCTTKEAEIVQAKYGVWVISMRDIKNDFFESWFRDFIFRESRGRRYGDCENNGWESIYKKICMGRETAILPSNSLIMYDNYSLKMDRNLSITLSNYLMFLKAFVPQSLEIDYYVLVVAPIVPPVEWSQSLDDYVNRWIKEVQQLSKNIKVEFLVLHDHILHPRHIYANYFFVKTERGFKIFNPKSNRFCSVKDGNEIQILPYFEGHDLDSSWIQLVRGNVRVIKEAYVAALKNQQSLKINRYLPFFIGEPLSTNGEELANRVFNFCVDR